MKQAIKANLEYITDREVLRSGVDSKEYQYAMLKTHILPQNPTPVNNFNFLTIKKRIAMINKKPSNRLNLGKYLLLPVAMLFMLVVGNSKARLNETRLVKALENFTFSAEDMPSVTSTDSYISASPEASNPDTVKPVVRRVAQQPDTNKLEIIQIRTSDDPYGVKKLIKDLSKPGIHGKEPIYIIDGARTLKNAIAIQPDSIATVNVYRVQGKATINELEVENDIIDIKTKSYKGPDTEKIPAISYNYNKSRNITAVQDPAVMLILDGEEIDKIRLAGIKPADIESINVLKGNSAVDRYGEKAKDGVVVIKTKKD